MAYSINDIRANLRLGGARPTLFRVQLTSPGNIGIDLSVSEFMIQASSLPGSTIAPIEIPYFGRKVRIAGDRTFEPWSVTVMNDEDFAVRALFEKWSNALNRMVSNVRDPSIATENYKVDLDVVQYAKDGATIRAYQLIGAWPTGIGPIGLNWESGNAIEEFSVNFAYDYWVPAVEVSDKKAGGVNLYGGSVNVDGINGPN